MSSHPDVEPVEPAKKRRRTRKPKESIYVKPDPVPYTPAIRPLKARRRRPTPIETGAAPNGHSDGEINEAESSRMAIERAEANNEKFRARSLKAWETKRRKQQERFEALESSTWNGPTMSGREHEPAETSFSADPFLAHLYVPDDMPKDDLLQSIHAYASRQYTVNNILLPPHRRKRWIPQEPGHSTPQTQSRLPTPAPSIISSADDMGDSGSEFSPEDDQEPSEREANDGDVRSETADIGDGRRRRGGQRGKRKLRDMHLALDGPALIALGTLIQELVIQGLRQEGYVAVEAEGEDSEGDFEVSDDDTE